MKVFILEDDPQRMLWFRETFIDHEITHAESCTQVDRFQPPYGAIFLDHDLGGRQLEDYEDNGAAFARLIAPKIAESDMVIVHSYNADGAKAINAVLGGGCYMEPFRGIQFNALVGALVGHLVR